MQARKKRRGWQRKNDEAEGDTDQTAPEFSSSAAPMASNSYQFAWAGPGFVPETPPPKKAQKTRDMGSLAVSAHEGTIPFANSHATSPADCQAAF
jgi:hypothetical protein